jgi:hypothetical protein
MRIGRKIFTDFKGAQKNNFSIFFNVVINGDQKLSESKKYVLLKLNFEEENVRIKIYI